MANYKINQKSKSISVSGVLTETEKEILSTYIKSGYVVREKRQTNAATVKDEDILAYFDEKKDAEGKAKYEAEKSKKKIDKNGKERKAGFLVALKWFKDNYAEAYKEIKAGKK
jgi:hypothetical protein